MYADQDKLEEIVTETKTLWYKHYSKHIRGMISDWARGIHRAITSDKIKKARGQFRQWQPLRVYTSVDEVKKNQSSVKFSLRYDGQEVAELSVSNSGVELNFAESSKRKSHERTNYDYFGYELPKNEDNIPIHSFKWANPYARKFRNHFKQIRAGAIPLKKALRSVEHKVESLFIEEMEKKTGSKCDGKFKNIQPVVIAGCPFQMPTPIKASNGLMSLIEQSKKPEKGNIDIIARRKDNDNRVRISVWELKRPGKLTNETLSKAVEQVVIYGTTLLLMLRANECGTLWYKNLGFKRAMPKKLKIEAVIAVTKDGFDRIVSNNNITGPLMVDNDSIRLYCACYDEDSYKILKIEEIKKK